MNPRGLILSLVLAASAASLSGALQGARAQQTLTVFAAASLKNALDDVNRAFTARTGIDVATSYAASSALAKQLESGAPADIFISADLDWMTYSLQKKTVRPGSNFNLLGNRLVLIAPKDSRLADVKIGQGFDLAALAGEGRIATGDVRAVPVGRYAKAALEKLGAWQKAEPKMAMAENVRAALALVGRNEAPLGIVYETDAKVEANVKIVGVFPADSYPPVVYPAGITAAAKDDAQKYGTFLRSATAQVIFERYGFTYLVKAGP